MKYSIETFFEVSSCAAFKIRWLSPGAFAATLETAVIGRARLYKGSVSQRALVSVPTPPGFCTIICPSLVKSSFQFLGETIDAACFGIGGEAGEPRSLVLNASGFLLCQIPVSELQTKLPERRQTWSWNSNRHLSLQVGLGSKCVHALNDILDRCRMSTDLPSRQRECSRVESKVLAYITELLTLGRAAFVSRARINRQQVLERALETIDRQTGPFNLHDLAHATGASPRTLQRLFRETLQYAPQKYVRWRRLCGLRHDLAATPEGTTTVTEIASRWGFTEMGRVSGEYRQLFGESPSATLKRSGDRSDVKDTPAA